MKKILLFVAVTCLAYVAIASSGIMESQSEMVEEPQVAVDVAAKAGEGFSYCFKAYVQRCAEGSGVSAGTKAFFAKEVVGTTPLFLAVGIGAIILAFVLRFIVKAVMGAYWAKAKDKKTLMSIGAYLLDLVKPFNSLILLFGLGAFLYLNVSGGVALTLLSKILIICVLWVALGFVLSVVRTFFKLLAGKVKETKPSLFMLIPLFRSIAVSLSVIIFLLLVLENFGVNVSAIIASLGIGGAALAFASQDTIANFFGSVSLIIDRPFVVGDEVMVGSWHGFVENIGLRSTTIRTFHSELVCIPNSTLANEHIKNNSARTLRRVEFKVGLVYSTTQDELKTAVDAIEAALNNTADVDVVIVRFDEFADSSLNIYVIYTTNVLDYAKFMELKELANFNIMSAVRGLGLSMAFPSRSLYIENESISISKK